MGWYAYDADGYVGDVGTNTGWADLCDFFRTSGNEEAKFLADNGWVNELDFRSLGTPGDEVVRQTLENLKQVAVKCREVLIVTNGVADETEEGEQQE